MIKQRERRVRFFPKQYDSFCFSTQFGAIIAGVQCIDENEFVYTQTGIKQVKEIQNGDKVIGGIVKDRYELKSDIFEVVFNNGIKIKVNGEHPFYVKLLQQRKEQWVKLKEIRELFKKKTNGIPIARVYFYKSNEVLKNNGFELKTPKLLGYLLSDGHWTQKQSVKFTNTNYNFVNEVKLLSEEFNKEIKPKLYRKGNGWDLLLTTRNKGKRNPFKIYFNNLKITSNGLGRILEADENSLKSFIQGYFNGDGYLTIYKNRKRNRKDIALIGFCVGISEKQAKEIQYLLWRLNIVSHIRKEWFKKSKQSFFRVVVDQNSTGTIIDILDYSKYPEKFYTARKIKQQNVRNYDNWITITKIRKIGKGKVVGWKTKGNNEIVSYCGMKTHNSGKTFTGAHWAGKKIMEFKEKNGIIIAPTYKILQSATMEKFFEVFPELQKDYKEHKGEIVLPTGGKVFTRSADRPLGIEGITASWIWLDEGGQAPRMIWTVARSRVSMTGGQILITTTPYSLNWLYQEFYLPWKEKVEKDFSVFTWKSVENPYFPKEFYEAEKRRLRAEEFARRYMGEFSKMEGLVYDLPEEQIIEPIENLMGKAEARIIGVDWGFRNPSSVVNLYLYDNCWYVVEEWKEAERTTAEIIQVINNKLKEHRANRVYPDPAEPDRAKECKDAHIAVMEVNKDIKGGVSYLQQLIKEKRFFVYKSCVNVLDEINTYHYPEGEEGKPFKDEPFKFNDHLLDAIRYAIYSFTPVSQIISKATEPIKPYYGDKEISF